MNWKKYFIASPITPSGVLSQFIWYNSYIKIDSKAVYLKSLSTKNINFVIQLFHTDGSVKNWNILKTEYALQNKGPVLLVTTYKCHPRNVEKMY